MLEERNHCTVCGADDLYSEEKLPHKYFCEHCFNVLDDWFMELSMDLRTSVRAWHNKEIEDKDVIEILETFVYEKGRMIDDSSNDR